MTNLTRLSSRLFTVAGKIAGAAGPQYTITPSTTTPSEGATITFTVTTIGLPNATYYWAINVLSGSITSTDFTNVLANLQGAVTVTSGSGAFGITLQYDLETESESFNVSLRADWGTGGAILANSSVITISDATPPGAWDLGEGSLGQNSGSIFPDFGTNTWPYFFLSQQSGPTYLRGIWFNKHGTYQSTVPYSGNASLGNGVGGYVGIFLNYSQRRLHRINFPYKDFRSWNRQTGWDFQNENYNRLDGIGGYHITGNPALGDPQALHIKPGGRWYYVVDRSYPTPNGGRFWHGEFGLEGPGGINDTYYINVGAGVSFTDWIPHYSWNPIYSTIGGFQFSQNGTSLVTISGNSNETAVVRFNVNPAFYTSNTSLSFPGDYYWPFKNLAQTNVPISGTTQRGMFWKPDGTAFYVTDTNLRFHLVKTAGPWNLSRCHTEFHRGETATACVATTYGFYSIFVNSSGTEMFETTISALTYTAPGTSDAISRPHIEKWNLGGWVIDGASFNQRWHMKNFFHNRDTSLTGFLMNSSRTIMTFLADTSDHQYLYRLGTAGDISTAVWAGANAYPRMLVSTTVSGYSPGTMYGISLKSDGSRLYALGTSQLVQFDLSTAWRLGSAEYSGRFTVSSQDSAMRAIYVKDDNNFYLLGLTNDRVYQYNWSSGSVTSASYSGSNFLVSGQETNGTGLFFKSDGTRMFVLGTTNRTIRQYALSTAWTLSSATYTSSSSTKSVASQTTTPAGLFIDPSGERVVVSAGSGTIYQYAIWPPWEFGGTFTYQGSRGLTTDTGARGIFIGDSGNRFWTQSSSGYVYEHITSSYSPVGSYSQVSLNQGDGWYAHNRSPGLGGSIAGGIFSEDGLNWLIGISNNLYGFTCSAAWNLETMTYYWDHARSTTFPTLYATGVIRDMVRPSSNTTLLITSRNGYIEKWTTGGFLPQIGIGGWLSQVNITSGVRSEYFRTSNYSASELAGIQDFRIVDNDTRILVLNRGSSAQSWKFIMSSALDFSTINTASSMQGYLSSDNKGPSVPYSFDINLQGNVVYLGDNTSTAKIYRHNLATNFELGTNNFPSGAHNTAKAFTNRGYYYLSTADTYYKIKFRPDGTRMYICTGDAILDYTLSTAWELSSATLNSTTTFTGVYANLTATQLRDFHISTDGTKLSILSVSRHMFGGWTLGTAWSINTASRTDASNLFSMSNEQSQLASYWWHINDSGTEVIVYNGSSAIMYKYTMSSALNFTTTTYVSSVSTASSAYSGGTTLAPYTAMFFQDWATGSGGPFIGFGLDDATSETYYYPFSQSLGDRNPPVIKRYNSGGWGSYSLDQKYYLYDKMAEYNNSLNTTSSGIFVGQEGTRFFYLGGSINSRFVVSFKTFNPGGDWNFISV